MREWPQKMKAKHADDCEFEKGANRYPCDCELGFLRTYYREREGERRAYITPQSDSGKVRVQLFTGEQGIGFTDVGADLPERIGRQGKWFKRRHVEGCELPEYVTEEAKVEHPLDIAHAKMRQAHLTDQLPLKVSYLTGAIEYMLAVLRDEQAASDHK